MPTTSQKHMAWVRAHPEYLRAKGKRRYERNRKLINDIKLARGCEDDRCAGHLNLPECLDFDHVRGDKEMNISRMTQLSMKRILREIEKCDVVCANCHRIRTQERLDAKDDE